MMMTEIDPTSTGTHYVFDHIKFKAARKAAGLSQGQLSKATGLALNTVIKLEYGEIERPRFDTLLRLANVLGVEPKDLLTKRAVPEPAVDEPEPEPDQVQ